MFTLINVTVRLRMHSYYRLVRVLLDEVISSTIGRCRDPILMEQSVSICTIIITMTLKI